MSSSVAISPSQSNVNFPSAINYEFAAVPMAMLNEIDHPTALRLIVVLYDCIRRGWVDPPIRYLATRVDRCRKQVERALAILETAGRLLVTRRKISPTRNGTNVYAIPGFSPSATNVAEVLTADVKAKAPQPAAPAPSLPFRNRENENSDLRKTVSVLKVKLSAALEQIPFLKSHAQRGHQIIQGCQRRNQRESEAQRMAVLARVGTWRGPEPTEQERQELEEWWRRRQAGA